MRLPAKRGIRREGREADRLDDAAVHVPVDAQVLRWVVPEVRVLGAHEASAFVLESRGFNARLVRSVTSSRFPDIRPADELQKLKVLPEFTETEDFQALAVAFKRAKNITREMNPSFRYTSVAPGYFDSLKEPAERNLLSEIQSRRPTIETAVDEGRRFREAFAEAAKFKPAVDRFFADVLVMAPEPEIRERRLVLVWQLVALILKLADISEIITEEKQA